MPTLYVVATPIGNLADLTQRAADVLRSVPVVAAEDTRVTRRLLNHLDAKPRVVSFHAHSRKGRAGDIVAMLAENDVALVTDAGTPGLSDPGAELVRAAAGAGHTVVAVPGPSAVAAALSVSGFDAGRFRFLGFLPRNRAERDAALLNAATEPGAVVLYEAPHRTRATLESIAAVFGERPVAVCRELTKLHEEVFRGAAAEALAHFTEPRGEFVIVIEGATAATAECTDEQIAEALSILRASGLRGRSLVDAAVEATGASRSRVYRLSLKTDSSAP